MSVINKMLRDLDQRQARDAASDAPGRGLPAGTAVLADFAQPVSAQGASPRRARPALLVLACAVLALVVFASWVAAQRAAPAQPVDLAPKASAPTVVAAPEPVASAPVLVPQPSAVAIPSAVASTPVVPAAPLPPSVTREPAIFGLRMDTNLSTRRLAERAPAAERAATPVLDVPKSPTPNEALERAQVLWNSGSREAAIDLLQEAVQLAERAGASSSSAQSNPVLLPLVRELTRMQLAESRYGAVWDLLTRLEPQLGAAADLWAIRANAAQRLGRHQDSVHAYMVALQSRPNEQRWLLGAAVSLAALGQTRSATEMADKARAVGVVSPEVLAYLRQMGVPLGDK